LFTPYGAVDPTGFTLPVMKVAALSTKL